jgi:hypothetical protein
LARATPAWVVLDDYVDTDLGNLKTGKEAEIRVVERVRAGGTGPARSATRASCRNSASNEHRRSATTSSTATVATTGSDRVIGAPSRR